MLSNGGEGDDMCLSAPPGYAVTDAARTTGRGGGVAIVYRHHLKCFSCYRCRSAAL